MGRLVECECVGDFVVEKILLVIHICGNVAMIKNMNRSLLKISVRFLVCR